MPLPQRPRPFVLALHARCQWTSLFGSARRCQDDSLNRGSSESYSAGWTWALYSSTSGNRPFANAPAISLSIASQAHRGSVM